MTASETTDGARKRTPLEPGDFAPNFDLADLAGGRFVLYGDAVVGRPVVLLFPEENAAEADAFVDAARCAFSGSTAERMTVAVVGAAAPGLSAAGVAAGQGGCDVRLLEDPGGAVRRGFGMDGGGAGLILLDPQCRLFARFAATDSTTVETAARQLERMLAGRGSGPAQSHAPVLWLTDLLEPDECWYLVELWERHRTANGGGAEPDEAARLKRVEEKIGRRVIPQILKAFNYRVTRRDSFHIACYDGSERDELGPRRHNARPDLAYRRFSIVLNLNTGAYEGGEIRFREYGDQLYRPETGAALVFSSALLHEILPVTGGRRFALLSHFFGDEPNPRRSEGAAAGAERR